MDELKPDVMFFTEANIFKDDPDHRINIDRYNIELPLTFDNVKLQYARIAVVIKKDLSYEVLKQHMSNDLSSLWLKIIRKGSKKLNHWRHI